MMWPDQPDDWPSSRPDTASWARAAPRRKTGDELAALGHEPMNALKALRLRCVDCSGGSTAEVRECEFKQCPSWPFRMGTNPWRAPQSEAQLAHSRTLASGRPRLAKKQPSRGARIKFQEVPATTLPADFADEKNHQAVEGKSEGPRNGGDASPQHAERVDGGAQ